MPLPAKKIRVLIIDDSASVRQALTHVLEQDPEIEVMGTADSRFGRAIREPVTMIASVGASVSAA